MVRNGALACLALAACQFDTSTPGGALNGDDSGSPPLIDAAPAILDANQGRSDAELNINCTDWAMQPMIVDPCATGIDGITDPLLLDEAGQYLYDTDTGILLDPNMAVVPHNSVTLDDNDSDPRIIVAGSISIAAVAELRATGDRPLILFSWTNINVAGSIDVGSGIDAVIGAGANSDDCDEAEAGEQDDDGGGGGGGGGFGGSGGDGADGRRGENTGGSGGDGGAAVKDPGFRGGCAGADGGDGAMPLGGAGGSSGGAVYLLARKKLQISGAVLSGGQGGGGAQGQRSAGAGGGSGGMIGLEAEQIGLLASTVIAANGGGGGGGGNNNNPVGSILPGQSGQASGDAALGGDGEESGPGEDESGDGGDGGALAEPNGQDGFMCDRGGGGGGGGAGFITVRTLTFSPNGAIVSPAVTP